MQDLGLTSHIRYSELVENLKVPKVFETLDLHKLKGFMEGLESGDQKEAIDYQNAKEMIQEVKEFIRENDMNVGRMYSRSSADESNGITPRDFYVLIHKIMPEYSKKDIADMFAVIDNDGNGILQK